MKKKSNKKFKMFVKIISFTRIKKIISKKCQWQFWATIQ